MKRVSGLLAAAILLMAATVWADVPKLINFQGILKDSSGNPLVNDTLSVEFKIYDADVVGNVKWMETQTIVTDTGGLFNTLLGSVNALVDSVFNDSLNWLGIRVEADPEMTPRQRLTSVPYSFKSSTGPGAKIINVTIHQNSTRTPLATAESIIMESFLVDKKSPTSILLIQGNLSGFGSSGFMTQGWKYGNSSEVVAQFSLPNELLLQTTAVISGHSTIGPQTLTFRYFSNQIGATGRPFSVYNPNTADGSQLEQTQSVYTIWEIEP